MIPGLGRSSGEGNGTPLQYSCLENPMDGGYSPWGRKESDTTERLHFTSNCSMGLPRWLSGKEYACQCRRHRRPGYCPWVGKIPWGVGNGNHSSFPAGENAMDRGAWQAMVRGVTKCLTQLNTRTGKQAKLFCLLWTSGPTPSRRPGGRRISSDNPNLNFSSLKFTSLTGNGSFLEQPVL